MSTVNKGMILLMLLLAGVSSVLKNVVFAPKGIDNLIDVACAADGESLVAGTQGGSIVLWLLNEKGSVLRTLQFPQTKKGETTAIADLAVGENRRVYLLRDYLDAGTGSYLRQDLEIYNMDRRFPKRVAVHSLRDEEHIRYRWISLSNVAMLIGTGEDGTKLKRVAYGAEDLIRDGLPASKGTRVYSIDPAEGIFQAVPASARMAYSTKSGKIFVASEEGEAREIYPARELQRLMYPMFLAPGDGEHVVFGEQESGDICALSLTDGGTQVLRSGAERFTGLSNYGPGDILVMSMRDQQNFTAVVKNPETSLYELVICQNGSCQIVSRMTPRMAAEIFSVLGFLLLVLGAELLLWLGIGSVMRQVRASRTILFKLAFSSLPLLGLAFALFGLLSYSSYSDSIQESFQKQVEDEGNLLTALFGTESFNEIEFPYDYTTEGYSYLSQQMSTREVYTRTAYFENDKLYTGVDRDLPCFYPFDLVMNSSAVKLYQDAARSGVAQTGVLQDRLGKRVVCVTPIGGVEGNTIYLLETGIPFPNMEKYTNNYLLRYLLVSALFILVIGTLLLMVFMGVLKPLGQIKTGLDEFSKGNRKVRIENETRDELSDIARVFNKMATDIDVQIYHLKSLSDTYYRFVPQRIFRLLGKDNLGDLELGNHVEGTYNVLCVELRLNSEKLLPGEEQELIDQFFNIINRVSGEYDATLVVDSVNLCGLKIICPEAGEKGVDIALSALAQIDGYNAAAGLQNRLDVMFLLHRTHLYYGICGDEQRYIPAMISLGLEALEEWYPLMRQFSCRTIVTQDACDAMDRSSYFSRFIGKLDSAQFHGLGLYDFYDGSSPEIIRLINETRAMFDKAMELYQQGRYYDAKNLFAVVLRENQYDNVARYYIFQCEKKLR